MYRAATYNVAIDSHYREQKGLIVQKKRSVIVVMVLACLVLVGLAVDGYPQQKTDTLQSPDKQQPPTAQRPFPKRPKNLGAGLEVLADLSVTPFTYDGPCPATFTLKGYISTNKATTVQYKLVRSDGVVTKPVTLTFDKPGRQEVTATWQMGDLTALPTFSGWAFLEVVYPLTRKMQSNTVFPKGTCTGQGKAAPESLPGQPTAQQGQLVMQSPLGQQPGAKGTTVLDSPLGEQAGPKAQSSVDSPLGPQTVQQGPLVAGKEDCVTFDPATMTVQHAQGRWTVASGPYVLFSFGLDKVEAENALAIIKQYKMNQSCFVGRPKPLFHYMLAGGSSPMGPFKGEDCRSFDPATTTVQQVKDTWKIVDRNNVLFDFGADRAQAEQSLTIIKKYGFTHSCMMARSRVDFLYLRK